jgi:signal transduction histidine kinase
VQRLRAILRRIVLAADANRRSLERELHDGLQQDLVALVVNLQLARRLTQTDPPAAAKLLDDTRRDAQAALDASRKLALRLYPPVLDAAGLRAALREASPTGVTTTVEVHLVGALPEALVASAYLCCAELLKRSDGDAAVVVRCDDDALRFDVRIAAASPDLTSLQDRVEALDGQLVSASEPGGGICVSGEFPLPR